MRRLHLASLALASTLLLTLSGCASTSNCDDGGGRFFSRFFNRSSSSGIFHGGNGGNSSYGGMDCECQRPGWPQGMGMPMGQGPFLVPPTTSAANPPPPIPITNTHVAQPSFLKVPNAPPTAYVPTGN
jgi:hypothetical protein